MTKLTEALPTRWRRAALVDLISNTHTLSDTEACDKQNLKLSLRRVSRPDRAGRVAIPATSECPVMSLAICATGPATPRSTPCGAALVAGTPSSDPHHDRHDLGASYSVFQEPSSRPTHQTSPPASSFQGDHGAGGSPSG